MFSFVEIQQSNQQVGLKDYRLKQSKVHRAPCLHRPDAFSFCSFSSLSQLSLFAFCLPSRISWYPVFPYTILQRCNNWQAPRLEKRVTRSMISYFTICFGIQTCKYRFTLIAHDCLQVALLSKYNFT